MAKATATIRPAQWKGGLGAFQATLTGIDFKLVKQLEVISKQEVDKLKAVWPIGPDRNRPHSVTLFRVQRKRRQVVVTNAAPYALFIVSPRTIGSAEQALTDMVANISASFAAHLRRVNYRAN